MFNLGDAMKNISAKAEELVEEKKNAATSLLEKQVKETGEFLAHTLNEAEGKAVSAAEEAKHVAVDGFDQEIEKITDSALQEYSKTGDGGLLGSIMKSSIDQVTNQLESGAGNHAALDLSSLIGDTVRSITTHSIPNSSDTTMRISDRLKGTINSMPLMSDKFVIEDIVNEMNSKVIEVAGDMVHKMQDVADEMANKVKGAVHVVNKIQGYIKIFGNAVIGITSRIMNYAVNEMMKVTNGVTNRMMNTVQSGTMAKRLTLTNIIASGFGISKLVKTIITTVVPVTMTVVDETKRVSVTIIGRILSKAPTTPTPPAAEKSSTASTVDQVASEAKTLVDKTAAELKPALGQVVTDKVSPVAQGLVKTLEPIAGDLSSQINTALADGVKQLNPIVDDVTGKAKGFVDDTAKQVSAVVDDKLKVADELLSEKREALGEPAKSILSKAKGLFGCKSGCCTIA